jgi:hypothetical protein
MARRKSAMNAVRSTMIYMSYRKKFQKKHHVEIKFLKLPKVEKQLQSFAAS